MLHGKYLFHHGGLLSPLCLQDNCTTFIYIMDQGWICPPYAAHPSKVKGKHYSQQACDHIIPAREAYASSVCCHYAPSKPHKGPAIQRRILHSTPLRLIGYYLNEPMFYIRAFDCITTALIFRGSAGGQGALSRLTPGSQEPELQSGTWQWMSPNDLDGICYTARRKPISLGNLAVEKKQRFKNKPHLSQIGVMLPHQCSTSLEFPSRMTNNYTQMTTQTLWTHRL